MFRPLCLLVLSVIICLVASSRSAQAGFVITLDAADTTAIGGSAFQLPVDVIITHDTLGESTFSSISFDVAIDMTGGMVSLADDLDPNNPLNFDSAEIFSGTASFSNFAQDDTANVDIGNGGTAILTTLTFDIPANTFGSFPVNISFVQATRGGFLAQDELDATEFILVDSSLVVTAVPEPTSGVLVAGIFCAALSIRRRRAMSH